MERHGNTSCVKKLWYRSILWEGPIAPLTLLPALFMGWHLSIFELGLHFELNSALVKFDDSILYSCGTVVLTNLAAVSPWTLSTPL